MLKKGQTPKNIKQFIEGGKKTRFKKGEGRGLKTQFKKGCKSWNENKKIWGKEGILKKENPFKNKKHTEQTKEKISKKKKGKKVNYPKNRKGHITSEKTKRKIGLANKGNQNWKLRKTFKRTQETINKIKEKRKLQILPKKDTSIEVKIQNFLKELNIDFFTHQYMKIEHGYQCDILIPSKNLIIECDGDYWHKYPIGRDIDHIRTKELLEKGFKVLRLWEYEIKAMNINKFKEKI